MVGTGIIAIVMKMMKIKMSETDYKAFKKIACFDGDYSIIKLLGLRSVLRTEIPTDKKIEVQKTLEEVNING